MKKQIPLKDILASPRLTCRDLEVLSTIGKLRVATPRLLAEVFLPMYPEASRLVIIRRRLRVLTDLGLLDRWRPRLGLGEGTAEMLVFLSDLGKQVVEFKAPKVPVPHRVWIQTALHTHEVALRGYLPLLRACRLHDSLKLQDVVAEVGLAEHESKYTIRPDMTFKFLQEGEASEMLLCLEWDRATMTAKQLLKKAERYEGFCREVNWAPLVALVTTSWQRVMHISTVFHKAHLRVQWFLTTAEDYERLPLGRIWLRPGKDETVRLPL